MFPRFIARVALLRVTMAYALIVTGVTIALYALGPQVQDQVVRHVSTNLHNLSHGHFSTLLSSAFVVDAGPIYVWLPGLVCLLALAELTYRSGLLLVVFATGHIGATLVVAAALTTAVELHWLPLSISRATDVGMSYGAAAVLGTLTAAIPTRWRPAWIGCFVALGATIVALGHDFTDIGHATALALGMLISTRLHGPLRWTPLRVTLLGVAAAFGYLVLASTDFLVATAAGLAGAVIAECLVRVRARHGVVPRFYVRAAAQPAAELMG